MPLITEVPMQTKFAARPGSSTGETSSDDFFLRRVRFSCEQSLVDEQVTRSKQPAIARHDVAGLQLDDVAGHEPIHGDLLDCSIAEHLSLQPYGSA